jgi:hypothetical protein
MRLKVFSPRMDPATGVYDDRDLAGFIWNTLVKLHRAPTADRAFCILTIRSILAVEVPMRDGNSHRPELHLERWAAALEQVCALADAGGSCLPSSGAWAVPAR